MPAAILELNDSEIRLARDTEVVLRTPGCAVVRSDSVILGEEAVKLSHLHPRETSNRFWSSLSQDPLAVRSDQVRHNADLAYRQLQAIHEWAGKPEEIIFSVPGSYSHEQLALLLGVVEACPFSAAGLVDTAVACAAAVAGSGDYVHMDIHLHQTILTFLSVDERVNRNRVQVIDDCGITDIYDTCAGVIADLFIQQSRFDPLHHARTEQLLYDQIPRCLTELNEHNETSLEIQYEQTRHQVRLLGDSLLQALEKHYARILNAAGSRETALIGDRLGNLPGFRNRLQQARLLQPETVFHGIHSNYAEIHASGPPLSFVTSLPAGQNPGLSSSPAEHPGSDNQTDAPSPEPVSHILIEYRAIPLGYDPLFVSANGRIDDKKHDNSHCSIRLSDDGVAVKPEGELSLYINGHRINAETLVRPGDTLGFAGSDTTFRFIHVMPV